MQTQVLNERYGIMKLKKLCLTTYLLTYFFLSFSQSYHFNNYGVKHGLAQSKVYEIVQDKEGYLWLGTESGVSQFDGVSFKNFTSEHGLADNGVRAIYIDSYNYLWLGHTGGGISRFDGLHFEVFNADSFTIDDDITSIVEDSDKNIWVSTHGEGVVKFINPEKKLLQDIKTVHYKGKEGLSDRVFSINKIHDGTLFFLTDVGIKILHRGSEKFEFYQFEKLDFFTTTLFEDSRKNIWLGTHNGGLFKYDSNKRFVKNYNDKDGLAHNFISCLAESPDGHVWAGTWGGGISVLSSDVVSNYNKMNGLIDNQIWTILPDREGNMIIGTNENGLMLFKGEHFIHYSQNNGLPGEQVLTIFQDKNDKIWFGTDKGIAIFSHDTISALEANNLTKDKILYIKGDKNNNIWFATEKNGVVEYSVTEKRFIYNSVMNTTINRNFFGLVTAMEIDRDNKLWVGTVGGLIYFDIDKNRNQIEILTQGSGLAGNDISSLFCDSKGRLWVGSKGFGITSIKNTTFTIVPYEKKFTPTTFTEDKRGNIWIGTEGQGVLICNGNSIVRQIKSKDGLLANNITLLNSNDENIYIGTNIGINRYDLTNDKIYSYNESSGFTGIETRKNASFRDREGNFWFGHAEGVTKYNIGAEKHNTLEPITHIKRFRVNLKDYNLIQNLSFGYRENSVVFDYSSICFSNPKAVRYKVMLEGADRDWRAETQQTFINYPALSPNNYTFKVIACNNYGVWNQHPETFSFQISPPYWKTWWFILTCVFFILIAIVAFIKIRTQRLMREKKILEQKVAERTAEVVQKNTELAKKNKSITDSIKYAKRIQDAMLPRDNYFEKLINDYFIYFKPRDIVSGDFYWITQKKNKTIIVAADCTGHGVPGAFMSMLGIALLNEIVNKKDVIQANEILNKLRDKIIISLKQSGKQGEAQDGIDLSLCIIDKENLNMQFSGANNPIFIVRNKKYSALGKHEIFKLKPDKMPIGIYLRNVKPFNNQTIKLKEEDAIYMFSDGYIDQFGQKTDRRFMTGRFKKMLLEIYEKPMFQQKEIIDQEYKKWKGELDQIDDILVVGVKI